MKLPVPCLAPLAILLALSGCAGMDDGACGPGLEEKIQAELIFGRNIGNRLGVSDGDWRRFLDEEVTPRFPAGFSVADLSGQYRGKNGVLVREPSKQLLIVISDGPEDAMKVNAIREAYKRRFQQESVLLVELPVCAGF